MSYWSEVPAGASETRLLAADVALGDLVGTVMVAGRPPDIVLEGLAATASLLLLHGVTESEAAAMAAHLEEQSPAAVSLARGETVDGLFVASLDAAAPLADLEAILERLGDGGPLQVAWPRGPEDFRLEPLLEAACAGALERPRHASLTFQRRGIRRGGPASAGSEPIVVPLPVSVIIVTNGVSKGLEQTLCDLLLRSPYVPAEVFVIDEASAESPGVPEDLFGLPLPEGVRLVLVPTGGVGLAAAINDALGGVEQPFVHLIDRPCRLAPHALAVLALRLEREDAPAAVIASHATLDVEGVVVRVHDAPTGSAVLELLDGPPPPLPALLFRTEALRAAEGLDPRAAGHETFDLLARLSSSESIVALPTVVLGTYGSDQRVSPANAPWVAGLLERIPVDRWLRGAKPLPRGERESVVSLRLAGFLLDHGQPDLALRVISERTPGPSADALALQCCALRHLARAAEALHLLEAYGRTSHPGLQLELVFALDQAGRRADAEDRLARLERRHPDLEEVWLAGASLTGGDLLPYVYLRRARGALPFGRHALAVRRPSDR